jgi:hypothetical protein
MLGGIGIGLQYPGGVGGQLPQNQNYYPQGNRVDMPAGAMLYVPPGLWKIRLGLYTMVQTLDPVSGAWLPYSTVGGRPVGLVNSDGNNFRILNPTGTVIGALVTTNGTLCTQAGTTATLSVGSSTWQPIVGNSVTSIAVGNDPKGVAGGSGYILPPIVDIQPPPPGGIPATAVAVLTAGAVSSITMINEGAGYTAGAPAVIIRPNPFDINIGTITIPVATATLGGGTAASGGVNALLCTNPGRVLTGSEMASATIAFAGPGAAPAATPIFCMAITAVAFSAAGGAGYPGLNVNVDSSGGVVTTAPATVFNPAWSTGLLVPRKCNIFAPVSGGALGAAVIIDGGIFEVAPSGIVEASSTQSAGLPTTTSSATFTMGGANDSIFIQQIGGNY